MPVLSLGETPLANALLDAGQLAQPEPRYRLDFAFCASCALAQITEDVPPEALFRNYVYQSSFSDTMLRHVRELSQRVIAERRLDARSLVLEIASNDGYLLQYYAQRGIPVLGVEPAAEIAALARTRRGIPTLVEFFGAALGERLAAEGRLADVVHAHNVFAHVPDPGDFARGLRHVLRAGGVAVIEAPYVRDLVEKTEFDTIYHEHYSYFSLAAVDRLLQRHGLVVADVERLEIHGGSLRYWVAHEGARISPRTGALLAEEERAGVTGAAFYRDFAGRVRALGDELGALLRERRAQGRRLAAYGASAKGATLLNAFGIGKELDFVVDRSTAKQGRYTPGTHLEILPPEALLERKPDDVLLLAWNLADEILAQQAEFRRRGGRFIVPVPRVRIV